MQRWQFRIPRQIATHTAGAYWMRSQHESGEMTEKKKEEESG